MVKNKGKIPSFLNRATTQTIFVILLIFSIQTTTRILMGDLSIFTLVYPLSQDPSSIILNIYSHAGFGHLVSNLIALVVFGYLVESVTTRFKFHAFFVITGIIASIAEITFWIMFNGTAIQVLGASGAIFGLMGYVLTGNNLSRSVINTLELTKPQIIGLFIIVSILITLSTGGSGVALIAHGTGLVIGLVSGYFKILHN